jgi:hypothetical protein
MSGCSAEQAIRLADELVEQGLAAARLGQNRFRITSQGADFCAGQSPRGTRTRCCRCGVILRGPIRAVADGGRYECLDRAICDWRLAREVDRRQLSWNF